MKNLKRIIMLLAAVWMCSAGTWADDGGTVGDIVWELKGTTLTFSPKEGVKSAEIPIVNDHEHWKKNEAVSSIVINDGITAIGFNAFYAFQRVSSVSLGKDVKTIGERAFWGCKMENITLPEQLRTIGESAFTGCTSLKSITIPDNVKEIGEYAFSFCYYLTDVIIGENVKTIGDYAFNNCLELKTVTFMGAVPTIGEDIFEDVMTITDIYVPIGTVEAYKTALSGTDFADKVKEGSHILLTRGTTDATRNSWTMTMPAFDVELSVEYLQRATLVEGEKAPAAADGSIIMGTDTKLVTPADSYAEGTMMYLVTATNEKPTTTTNFSSDVPTAESTAITKPGDYYVWFYIAGDDEHSDSQIFAEPVKVTILSNKFKLTFATTGALTIQGGLATVSVQEGNANPVNKSLNDNGELEEEVTAGSTVTVTAKAGYKFTSAGGERLLTRITPCDYGDKKDPMYSTDGVATLAFDVGRCDYDDEHGCWKDNGANVEFKVQPSNGYTITKITFKLEGDPSSNISIPYDSDGNIIFNSTTSPIYIYLTVQGVFSEEHHSGINYGGYGISEFKVYGYKNDEALEVSLSADGSSFSFTMPTKDAKAYYELERTSYKLTVGANSFATYYSDEALTLGTEQTDGQLYTVSSVGTDAVTLSSPITVAPAKTPLLVWNGSDTEKDFLLMPTTDTPDEVTAYTGFKGTTTDHEFTATDMAGNTLMYVLAAGKQFMRVTTAGTIAAHRCWLEVSNGNSARQLKIGGETTSLSPAPSPKGEGRSCAQWYDLQGRKLDGQPHHKGVYIVDGQKRVVK